MARAAVRLGCETVQIFSRSPRGGKAKALLPDDVSNMKELFSEHDIRPLVIHAPYFMNLASVDPDKKDYSVQVLAEDLMRAETLGAEFVVTHIGHKRDVYKRQGLINGEFLINPTVKQAEESELSLVVAGTKDAILMVEAGANQVSEDVVVDAIMKGHEIIKEIVSFQEDIVRQIGKPKMEPVLFVPSEGVVARVNELGAPRLREAIRVKEKLERETAIDNVFKEVFEAISEEYPEQEDEIAEAFHDLMRKEVRAMILDEGVRPDLRRPDEIRPISCEVAVVPRVHGLSLIHIYIRNRQATRNV